MDNNERTQGTEAENVSHKLAASEIHTAQPVVVELPGFVFYLATLSSALSST